MKRSWYVVPVFLIVVESVSASVYDDTFQRAAEAYSKADYQTAIEQYEQLIAESVTSPSVFFNLGNAYYRNGRLGAAIANYERALALDPHLDGARENLEHAVHHTTRQLGRPLPPPWEQSLLFWHYGIGRTQTCVLAGGCWVVFWVLLGLRQWHPIRYLRFIAVVFFIFSMAFGVSAWAKLHPTALAVADQDRISVHYGTDNAETVRFELNSGDRVLVDMRKNGWSRVTTVDGQRGWAHDDELVFVGPPYDRPIQQKVSPGASS